MTEAAHDDSGARWREVDETAAPDTFVGYLDQAAALLRESRGDTMRLLDISPGCTILDVGCGAGELLIELAASSTDFGCVGLDASGSMIETATSRAAAAGVDVTFAVGDAMQLDVPRCILRPGELLTGVDARGATAHRAGGDGTSARTRWPIGRLRT